MNDSIKIMPFYSTTTKSGKKRVGMYIVDSPGRATIHYAETLSKARDYVKGYKKEHVANKTVSYIAGFKDRLRDDKIFNDEIAI